MDGQPFARAKDWYNRWFPERQVILRSRGQVRYVALSPRMQAWGAAGAFVLLGWLAVATASAVTSAVTIAFREIEHQRVVTGKERSIAELIAAYEQISEELAGTRTRYGGLSRELEDKLERMRNLTSQYGRLRETFSVTRAELEKVIDERDLASQQRDDINNRLEVLQLKLSVISREHKDALDRLTNRALGSIVGIEKAIRITGLDPRDLLEQVIEQPQGQGGPLIALTGKGKNAKADPPTENAEQAMQRLEASLTRWGGLQALLARMPFGKPAEGLSLSSGFGRRLDPFTRTYAFHSGIDIQGQSGSPIYATAPGIVVFEGRKGPYGLTVEVDHGFGFRTRYGHLKASLVEVGDQVTLRSQIGQMGSTGRSTGVHLHYEVLFNDEPFDPANFIEAGNHVYKLEEIETANRRK